MSVFVKSFLDGSKTQELSILAHFSLDLSKFPNSFNGIVMIDELIETTKHINAVVVMPDLYERALLFLSHHEPLIHILPTVVKSSFLHKETNGPKFYRIFGSLDARFCYFF